MAIIPKFKADVINGKLSFQEPQKMAGYVASLFDGVYEVIIRKPRKDRSDAQNRFFHGVVLKMIAEQTGQSLEEAKNMVKVMFLMVEKNGYITLRETKKLSTVEMEELNEQCRRWAVVELGINIPLPNEVDYSLYEEKFETDP